MTPTAPTCAACAFYRPAHRDGHCMNPRNAEMRVVGSYSSGNYADVPVPPDVWATQSCDLFTAGAWTPGRIAPVTLEQRQQRWDDEHPDGKSKYPADLRPGEMTWWQIAFNGGPTP